MFSRHLFTLFHSHMSYHVLALRSVPSAGSPTPARPETCPPQTHTHTNTRFTSPSVHVQYCTPGVAASSQPAGRVRHPLSKSHTMMHEAAPDATHEELHELFAQAAASHAGSRPHGDVDLGVRQRLPRLSRPKDWPSLRQINSDYVSAKSLSGIPRGRFL